MTPFTTNGREYLAVNVPSDATKIEFGFVNNQIEYISNGEYHFIDNIPQGNWQIFGLLYEIEKDEEKAKELVEDFIAGYRDYQNDQSETVTHFKTAIESVNSLKNAYQMWTVNPYAKTMKEAVDKSIGNTYENKLNEANIFREAQQHVSEWLILEKIK